MHPPSRFKTPVPADAVEIVPGYHMHASVEFFHYNSAGRTVFYVYHDDTRTAVASVNMPLTKTYRSRDDLPDAAMITPRIRNAELPEEVTRAVAETLMTSAEFAMILNGAYTDEIDKQQRDFEAYQRELKLKNQRDDEQFRKLYAQVIWMVGSKFRLRRRGKKATVFGEINHVQEPAGQDEQGQPIPPRNPYMLTTSEKGVSMRILLRDVIWMEVKEEDSSRRYTNIYTEEVI